MKVLIPSCRTLEQLQPMIEAIRESTPGADVIASCTPGSAAQNRNACLKYVDLGEVACMVDDDVEQFYPGWVEDLTFPFSDPRVVMVSARLLNPDGSFGATCSDVYADTPNEIEVFSNGTSILPSAAVAFRHTGIMFDEHLIGSGFDDSLWCHEILDANPEARFLQSNRCRLCHKNEMKFQKGKYWRHNLAYFRKKRAGKMRTPAGL